MIKTSFLEFNLILLQSLFVNDVFTLLQTYLLYFFYKYHADKFNYLVIDVISSYPIETWQKYGIIDIFITSSWFSTFLSLFVINYNLYR